MKYVPVRAWYHIVSSPSDEHMIDYTSYRIEHWIFIPDVAHMFGRITNYHQYPQKQIMHKYEIIDGIHVSRQFGVILHHQCCYKSNAVC